MIIQTLLSSNPGGIEVLIPSIIKQLDDYEVDVYLIKDNLNNDHCVFNGTEIVPIKGGRTNWINCILLYKFAKKHQGFIFQVYNIGPVFLLILRLAGVKKIIYSIHGTKYWRNRWQKFYRKILWRIALTKRIKIISNSEYSKARFKEQIWNRANIKRVYNPIDIEKFFYRKVSYPDIPCRIIYIGRLSEGKNMFSWIDTAAYLSNKISNIYFDIYGDGVIKKELEDYAIKKGLKEKITFHGFIKNIADIYRKGDLLLFLSKFESFGNVVVESVLSGTPVICSNIPSMREIFTDYPDFLVELNDGTADEVFNKINQYDHLVALTKKAQIEFKERFSVEQHISNLLEIYSELSG